MTIITPTQQREPHEYEDLLIDAVYAERQVQSLAAPNGIQKGAVRAYAQAAGIDFNDAWTEVRTITDQVSASSKLGVTRLDVRKAVAHHIDRLIADQKPEASAVEAEPDECVPDDEQGGEDGRERQESVGLTPAAVLRADYTAGLRALADILDAHPELPLPYDGNGGYLGFIEIGDEARRGAAVFARLMPGTVEKSVSDNGQFYLIFQLHGLRLKWIAAREEMCERVVVGTREVLVEEPDPEALALVPKITRTEVIEDVEWQCRPVLDQGTEQSEAVTHG